MTTPAIYLFFIAALFGYRASKYWPKAITAVPWLGNYVIGTLAAVTGAGLLLAAWGITIGLLLAFLLYTMLLSCIILLVNCNRSIRIAMLLIFHFLCILGIVYSF